MRGVLMEFPEKFIRPRFKGPQENDCLTFSADHFLTVKLIAFELFNRGILVVDVYLNLLTLRYHQLFRLEPVVFETTCRRLKLANSWP